MSLSCLGMRRSTLARDVLLPLDLHIAVHAVDLATQSVTCARCCTHTGFETAKKIRKSDAMVMLASSNTIDVVTETYSTCRTLS